MGEDRPGLGGCQRFDQAAGKQDGGPLERRQREGVHPVSVTGVGSEQARRRATRLPQHHL